MTTGTTMADHKLISTPVSIADGFKRGDRGTWTILLVAAGVALLIVVLINVFVDKPAPIRWPTVAPTTAPAEPRTYDVAPPDALPQPDRAPQPAPEPQGGRQ